MIVILVMNRMMTIILQSDQNTDLNNGKKFVLGIPTMMTLTPTPTTMTTLMVGVIDQLLPPHTVLIVTLL